MKKTLLGLFKVIGIITIGLGLLGIFALIGLTSMLF